MKMIGVLIVMGIMAGAAAAELPQIIAHRGGSYEQDENTLGAIKNSYAKGVRGFEIDVRMTKDRRMIVIHDELLERSTNGKGSVENMTAQEIAPARSKKTGEPVPGLEEILEFLKDKEGIVLQVEIKCGRWLAADADLTEFCDGLTKMVNLHIDPAKVVFICFEAKALRKIKKMNPKQKTCLVSSEVNRSVIKAAKEIGAEYLSVDLNNLCRAFVMDAHKEGLKVTTWTVRTPADAQLAILMGTDYVTTDIPAAQLEQKSARP